jgi:hypothetical protein
MISLQKAKTRPKLRQITAFFTKTFTAEIRAGKIGLM